MSDTNDTIREVYATKAFAYNETEKEMLLAITFTYNKGMNQQLAIDIRAAGESGAQPSEGQLRSIMGAIRSEIGNQVSAMKEHEAALPVNWQIPDAVRPDAAPGHYVYRFAADVDEALIKERIKHVTRGLPAARQVPGSAVNAASFTFQAKPGPVETRADGSHVPSFSRT